MCQGADPSFTPTHGLQSVVLLLVRISMYACVHVGIRACVDIYIYICIHICMYRYTRTQSYRYVSSHTRLTCLVRMRYLTYIHGLLKSVSRVSCVCKESLALRDLYPWVTRHSCHIHVSVTTCMEESRPADGVIMTTPCC